MANLDLTAARKEAVLKSSFFADLDQLQVRASKLYPGYTLVLSTEIEHPEFPLGGEEFTGKTGLGQIQEVMSSMGGPANLDALLTGIRANGGKMERAALMTYLSRGKAKGQVKKFGHGLWGLPEHGSQPEEGQPA